MFVIINSTTTRWIKSEWRTIQKRGCNAERYYKIVRDFFKASANVRDRKSTGSLHVL